MAYIHTAFNKKFLFHSNAHESQLHRIQNYLQQKFHLNFYAASILSNRIHNSIVHNNIPHTHTSQGNNSHSFKSHLEDHIQCNNTKKNHIQSNQKDGVNLESSINAFIKLMPLNAYTDSFENSSSNLSKNLSGDSSNDSLHDSHISFQTSLQMPLAFPNMNKAIDRIFEQIKQNKKIGIISDYDVDGATSAAILFKYLSQVYKLYNKNDIKSGHNTGYSTQHNHTQHNQPHQSQQNIVCIIPHRVKDGYGPSKEIFQNFKNQNIDLVFTLDCGTSAFEAIDYATEEGIDVIVIDHHTPKSQLPNAFVIINPYLLSTPEDIFEKSKFFAAVGVTYCLICAMNEKIESKIESTHALSPDQHHLFSSQSSFQSPHQHRIDISSYLDLVAIGTICDMMQLTGLNRLIVQKGLKLIQQQRNIGIKMLADTAKITTKIKASNIGFAIGPRINAGGRIGDDQYLGYKLLTTESSIEAMKIAQTLSSLNSIRQDINASTEKMAKTLVNENDNFILCHGNWHQGVIGIVASRLKEEFNKPAFAISELVSELVSEPVSESKCESERESKAESESKIDSKSTDKNKSDDILKGSCRSVAELHVGQLVERAISKGILVNGGGHAMAAGFALHKSKINAFREFLKNELQNKTWKEEEIFADCILSTQAIVKQEKEILNAVELLEPYGIGNKTPVFLLHNVSIVKIMFIKDVHMRVSLTSDNVHIVHAMAFNGKDSKVGKFIQNAYYGAGNNNNPNINRSNNHNNNKLTISCLVNISIWNESISISIQDAF
jgi:single-stranded-DNA-specific exonuclease